VVQRDVLAAAGDLAELDTTRAAISPGTAVELPDGTRMIVERVQHELGAAGSYRNRLVAVRAERWGLRTGNADGTLAGPFPAEVTHDDDPTRLGRIRVRLCEDPDLRPSPWIPWLAPAAGPATGIHWLPEVGSRVLVASPSESPESLIALGAMRGERQKVAASWAGPDNAIKSLTARNDIRLEIDDRQGSLLLQAGRARIELKTDGSIVVRGEHSVAIHGGSTVDVDAARINLGL
jgi:uncharacterized protein involved in type VI secretion and phage assembly